MDPKFQQAIGPGWMFLLAAAGMIYFSRPMPEWVNSNPNDGRGLRQAEETA